MARGAKKGTGGTGKGQMPEMPKKGKGKMPKPAAMEKLRAAVMGGKKGGK